MSKLAVYLRRLPGLATSSSSDAMEALLLRREPVDVADAMLSRRCCRHVEKSAEPREDTELLVCDGDIERSPPSSLESGIWEDSSPGLWTRACRRMLLRTLKLRPQPSTGHTNGFSPVWLLRWIFKLLGRLKPLPQYVHSYLAPLVGPGGTCRGA